MNDAITGDDGRVRPRWAATDPLLRDYYDYEWGVPVRTESGIYERISLEAFQSGLSWSTILRKREAFRAAFCDFDPEAVAGFGDDDVERLMADAGIVRNRRKIHAAITNARATLGLRNEGGLVDFVWSFAPQTHQRPASMSDVPAVSDESKALAKALRSKGFAFVGPTTMYALMQAIGLVDDHPLGLSEPIPRQG